MSNLFQTLTDEQQGEVLAQYMPVGKSMIAKDIKTTNLYKLLQSSSLEFGRITSKLNEMICQYDVTVTTEYIEEYEQMLGIPDNCFTNTETIERRRQQIEAKLRAIGTQTCQDLIDVIAILGVTIECETGFQCGIFPADFPWCFSGGSFEASHLLYITFVGFNDSNLFPVDFPWFFSGSSYIERIKCFIESLVPANVRVVFRFSDSPTFNFIVQDNDNFVVQTGDNFVIN